MARQIRTNPHRKIYVGDLDRELDVIHAKQNDRCNWKGELTGFDDGSWKSGSWNGGSWNEWTRNGMGDSCDESTNGGDSKELHDLTGIRNVPDFERLFFDFDDVGI